MQAIYKYNLNITDRQTIDFPSDTILSVQEQDGKIVVYAIAYSNLASRTYEFIVIGTGHSIHFDVALYKYLGTVKLIGGRLMFHVFYKAII